MRFHISPKTGLTAPLRAVIKAAVTAALPWKRPRSYTNVLLATTLLLPGAQPAAQQFWPIPDCAWSIPMDATTVVRGIPLGGIGAGAFMFNYQGTFGPFRMKMKDERGVEKSGAFHVYEKRAGQAARVTTLAYAAHSAWNAPPAGSSQYHALYPKAWTTCNSSQLAVSIKAFSPIIARNYKETSYPAAVLLVRLSNTAVSDADCSVMFTFPNLLHPCGIRSLPANRFRTEGAISGVEMTNGWSIATQPPAATRASWVSSWQDNGDGSDIYSDLSDNGVLSNTALDNSQSAGALAVTATIGAGQTVVIPFAIAWDPVKDQFGLNTPEMPDQWYRRYTEYFGTSGASSFAIAREALANHQAWEDEIDKWWNRIVQEPLYPDWLKTAALNELYYNTFGDAFWENGCITRPQESRWTTLDPADHKHSLCESQGYGMMETFDVRHYSCRLYNELWPEIERDVLKWYADYTFHSEDGGVPHDMGDVSRDPFFNTSGYGDGWQDMPSKLIQQCHAYHTRWQDTAFLDFVWPALVRTYTFMKTRKDTNGDGLPDSGNNTYDTWGIEGNNLFTGGLWVGALMALEELATVRRDALAGEIRTELARARALLDASFWQPARGYYRLSAGNPVDYLMADGLNGARFAQTCGLDPILPDDRMRSHLHAIFEACVRPHRDYTDDGIGDLGTVNAARADGAVYADGSPQQRMIWTGSSYFTAATMYHIGTKLNDRTLVDKALHTAYGVYYQTYVNLDNGYYFRTPEAWYVDDVTRCDQPAYQRPRAVWELLLEIKNPFGDDLRLNRDTLHFTADSGVSPAAQSITLVGTASTLHISDDASWLTVTHQGNSLVNQVSTTGLRSGYYRTTVRVNAASLVAPLHYNVVLTVNGPAVARSVVVTPAVFIGNPGSSMQFSAQVRDQFGTGHTGGIVWQVDKGGTIDANGAFVSDATTGTGAVIVTVAGNPEIADTAFVVIEEFRPQLAFDYHTGSMRSVTQMDFMTPVRSATTPGFDLSVRDRDSDFGIRFKGYLWIAHPDDYTFVLRSDDGSALAIDNTQLINFDGPHDMGTIKTGTIHLTRGMHAIDLDYYQGGGDRGLELQWKTGTTALGAIPGDLLFHLPAGITPRIAPQPGLPTLKDWNMQVASSAHSRQTQIVLTVPPHAGNLPVTMQVFDVRGRLVCTLLRGPVTAGCHRFQLSGDGFATRRAAGLLVCRITAADLEKTSAFVIP